MNFITLFETQCLYNESYLYKTLMGGVDATDYVFIPNKYGSANANNQVTALNNILKYKSNAKLWIGTPGIDSTNYNALPSLATIKNFITTVYNGVSDPSAIAGVYYNQESVYGGLDVSTGNLLTGSSPGNTQVKLMNSVKSELNSIIKTNSMLWLPYYGYGPNAATVIKEIGWVIETSKVFTYVCLQPHYLFDQAASVGNLEAVAYCVEKQGIYFRDKEPAVSSSNKSIPEIGFVMEYADTYSSYYDEYVEAFKNLKSYPYGFYWQLSEYNSISGYEKVKKVVNDFM